MYSPKRDLSALIMNHTISRYASERVRVRLFVGVSSLVVVCWAVGGDDWYFFQFGVH